MWCGHSGLTERECTRVRRKSHRSLLIIHFFMLGWNMKISARETNYGTRVDYILVTPGMVPWVKHGDIQPSLKGSDHCPIYIDLHDEITTDAGERLSLRDVLPMDGNKRDPPRLAAQRWEEYSGKQTLLSTFFAKGREITTTDNSQFASVSPTPDTESPTVRPGHTQLAVDLPPQTHPSLTSQKSSFTSAIQPFTLSPKPQPNPISSSPAALSSSSAKRQATTDIDAKKAAKKPKGGQSKLSAFFAQSSTTPSCSQTDSPDQDADQQDYMDSDYQLALELSASLENPHLRSSLVSATPSTSQSKTAWSRLMAPVQPPNCIIHGEPAKEYTVNKPGSNKGKIFFLCSRSVYLDQHHPFISHCI